MSQRRVVITGLGQVSPVGNDVATAWSNLLAGKSGIGRITRFDASDINSQIAGEVRDFDIGQYISAKEARRMDVFIHYGIAAALQAISDAGLDELESLDKDRVGVNIGSGIGGLPSIEATGKAVIEGGGEALYSVLAVHEQKSPPTINIFEQDIEAGCDLDYCANEARDAKIDVAISNSFGFGGTNGTLVFKRFKD